MTRDECLLVAAGTIEVSGYGCECKPRTVLTLTPDASRVCAIEVASHDGFKTRAPFRFVVTEDELAAFIEALLAARDEPPPPSDKYVDDSSVGLITVDLPLLGGTIARTLEGGDRASTCVLAFLSKRGFPIEARMHPFGRVR